nr:PEGA domain-containing protein [bacterium]
RETQVQTVAVSDLSLSSSAGEVVIKTDPPRASVVFNGQAIPAPTPVTIRKVPKDRQHSFTVTLEGYRPESRSFNMNEDTKTFSIKLEPR